VRSVSVGQPPLGKARPGAGRRLGRDCVREGRSCDTACRSAVTTPTRLIQPTWGQAWGAVVAGFWGGSLAVEVGAIMPGKPHHTPARCRCPAYGKRYGLHKLTGLRDCDVAQSMIVTGKPRRGGPQVEGQCVTWSGRRRRGPGSREGPGHRQGGTLIMANSRGGARTHDLTIMSRTLLRTKNSRSSRYLPGYLSWTHLLHAAQASDLPALSSVGRSPGVIGRECP